MKSYTDIEQSKKLAEILATESADMFWYLATKGNPKAMFNEGYNEYGDFELPCWSLAALLEIIKKCIGYSLQSLDTHTVFMNCELGGKPYNIVTGIYDNPIDACYEMILKLHELNLL